MKKKTSFFLNITGWKILYSDGRQGGTESADDPLSQNSEHSGARLLPSNASRSGGTQGNGYTEFSESETSSGEEDSEDEDNDQVMFSGDVGGTRPRTGRQVQESDHRTSSEMIADLMDSEEKMRSVSCIYWVYFFAQEVTLLPYYYYWKIHE